MRPNFNENQSEIFRTSFSYKVKAATIRVNDVHGFSYSLIPRLSFERHWSKQFVGFFLNNKVFNFSAPQKTNLDLSRSDIKPYGKKCKCLYYFFFIHNVKLIILFC